MAESFTTTNRFFDNKNYPRGFSRHGDFTIKEAQLLERHGYAFNELELGKREPVTEDEKLNIAKRHLLPKQIERNALKKGELTVDDSAIIGIIRYYTREAGVRSLGREISKLGRKAV
ncbi:DUF413 domain-containing protein, partial [Halomonas sp. EGI 63088]